ncbi:MAG: hypothetical protein HQK77_18645 [Desulfobacterales bacterium]|nr:hypothetical protein [Desulfobacterales bacterium]
MKPKNGMSYDQNYDFILKWMTELLRGETLEVIGLKTGKIKEVFTFEPVDIAVTSGRVDIMIKDDKGKLYHIEEQRDLSKEDLYRFAAYHFMGAKQYNNKLTDVIIASGNVYAGKDGKKRIRTPSGTYRPIVIDLSERNGLKTLNRIREEIRSDNLSSLMELVFVPLYGKETGLERSQLAEEVILLEKDLYQQGKLSVRLLAATFIIVNKMIDKNKLNDLWEEIKMVDILELAREKGLEEGIEKGLLAAREMLLDALMESFGVLPTHIFEKIKTISHPDTLRGLFRVALKSKNLEQFIDRLNQVSLQS